jgi:hypothetical protein
MHIDLIHPRRPFAPLQRLARWWQQLGEEESTTADPVQLTLLSEAAGRPYATALCAILLMKHLRAASGADAGDECRESADDCDAAAHDHAHGYAVQPDPLPPHGCVGGGRREHARVCA